jgi:hypothetical protein
MAADAGPNRVYKSPQPSTGWGLCRKPPVAAEPNKFPDVPGGDIFGFTDPADVGNPGDCGLAFEYSGAAGKADGRYYTGTLKTEFSATIAENLAVAVAPFVTHHRIWGVTGLDDLSATRFDGLSGELSYRFLERGPANRIAATFAVEPRWARVDGTSGTNVTVYSAEFKLFLDAVLVPDRLYGALNLNYAPAMQKAGNDPLGEWVRSSGTNVSGALAYQINDRLFVGAELRFLAAFTGAALNRNVGIAWFAGPTVMVQITPATALNLVWTPQFAGHADGNDRRLDLDNFERHQFRVKLATGF